MKFHVNHSLSFLQDKEQTATTTEAIVMTYFAIQVIYKKKNEQILKYLPKYYRLITELPIVFVTFEKMEEIPEFILRGVDVLNELLIMLQHPLNFQFSPEFLRRIKMNEDSIEDREQVSSYFVFDIFTSLTTFKLLDIVLTYISKYQPINVARMKTKSCHELVNFLCALCIEQQLWTISTFKRHFSLYWPKIQHILAPQCIFLQPTAISIDATVDIERELSLEEVSAITTKYTIIQNKLKKLRELEKMNIKLIKESENLLKDIEGNKQFHHKMILQNLLDGVQLKSSPTTTILPSTTEKVSLSFLDEIDEFRNFEKTLENEKSLEDLFLRWIKKPQQQSLRSPLQDDETSDIILSETDIVEAKKKTQDMVRLVEEEVITHLLKEKINVMKIRQSTSFLPTQTIPLTERDFRGPPSHSLFTDSIITQLLQLGENESLEIDPRGSVDEALVKLRDESHKKVHEGIEIINDSSPFHCVVHEENKPQTF